MIQDSDNSETELSELKTYISVPKLSEHGDIPLDFLQLNHSFGYDCKKLFNLCVADPNTIIFSSGNLIHFYDVAKRSISFRRCYTGQGIGHIAKNPVFNHIAVAENGQNPPIIIYEWPNFDVLACLENGTTCSYSHIAYNPPGLLLASQGGSPDYFITIWDWKKSTIVITCKSHSQDIYNVMFSPTIIGHLTTCGLGHIKFWKMSKTFTGLKLQGELGRFGKTEISDIIGVYPMPDEKVITGFEWGNILVWDEGLIKFEVCQKNRKPCHTNVVSQFEYNDGELVSVGMDGWIRVWYYETIDYADPPDEDRFLEVEPIREFFIGQNDGADGQKNSQLMSIQKRNPNDVQDSFWYAQDAKGGIWLIDLTSQQTPEPPRKIFSCHAGAITDMDVADWGPFVVTVGSDNRLHIYNYLNKKLIFAHEFSEPLTKVIWLPSEVDNTGCTLICGSSFGVVRILAVNILQLGKNSNSKSHLLLELKKPHVKPISCMSFNVTSRLLVTGGEDETIFIFATESTENYPSLIPIGFVQLPSCPTVLTWKPEHDLTILIGCSQGYCIEIDLPEKPQHYTTTSYELLHCKPRIFQFQSVRSAIEQNLMLAKMNIKKDEMLTEKKIELERLREENPEIVIDETEFLKLPEDEFQLPPIYIPETPNNVMVAHYISKNKFWLFMSGFDAGYIYEFSSPDSQQMSLREPEKSFAISNLADTEICTISFDDDKYLFLGLITGELRAVKINPIDITDWTNYWSLTMHDKNNGFVSVIKFSFDKKMLLSSGHDGNLFSYSINTDEIKFKPEKRPKKPFLIVNEVEDVDDPEYSSLQESIVKAEERRILELARQKIKTKMSVLQDLADEYHSIVKRNQNLPKSQRIPPEELELDNRITENLKIKLKEKMDLVHKKLAFKLAKSELAYQKLYDLFVKPLTSLPFGVCKILHPEQIIYSIRELELGENFFKNYNLITARLSAKTEETCSDKTANDMLEVLSEEVNDEGDVFFSNMNDETIEQKFGRQTLLMYKKYRNWCDVLKKRREKRKFFNLTEPDRNVDDPESKIAIENAKRSIGNHLLKTNPSYITESTQKTILNKCKQIMECRKRIHIDIDKFNKMLRDLRDKKVEIQLNVANSINKLKQIHMELQAAKVKPLPHVLVINQDLEFPEKKLQLKEYKSAAEKVKEDFIKRASGKRSSEPTDEEYEVLLKRKTMFSSYKKNIEKNQSKMSSKELKSFKKVGEALKSLLIEDQIETSIEKEMKEFRAPSKIHEQNCILKKIQSDYDDFDRQLSKLEKKRLEIVADSVYMDLFLLTLNQELIILKDYEETENRLRNQIKAKLKECDSASRKMKMIVMQVSMKNKEIDKTAERVKRLDMQFFDLIEDSDFAEYLKEIYEKLHRFKNHSEDSFASEFEYLNSTVSDDTDTGANSHSSNRFNEYECPENCDKELYNTIFAMREKRYEYLFLIKTLTKGIESLIREHDEIHANLEKVNAQLNKTREEYQALLLEKQTKLNDIDTTVVLKFDQIETIMDEESELNTKDFVLFDKLKLTKLCSRVKELEKENVEQKQEHLKYKTHLQRLKVDCAFMDKEVQRIKDEISLEMYNKFGKEISLIELYKFLLEEAIAKSQEDFSNIKIGFEQQINQIKHEYQKKNTILRSLLEENSTKNEYVAELLKEMLESKIRSNRKAPNKDELQQNNAELRKEIEMLQDIIKKQEMELIK